MSLSFHLFQLQKLDTQVSTANNRITEINRLLAQNEPLVRAQTQLNVSAEKLKTTQAKLREIEISVHNKRIKMEQSEAALYGGTVKNPKELQDLQTEIDSLKRIISQLEESQLEAMVAVEEAEQNFREDEALLNHVKAEQAGQYASLMGESSTLQALLNRLQIERKALVNQINPVLLDTYTQLCNSKRGLAVVAVEDDCCTACGTTLTAAEIQAARSANRLVNCPTCGRILYSG
jgi:predicted  nucleic acid-binding Zn-ribbon protein